MAAAKSKKPETEDLIIENSDSEESKEKVKKAKPEPAEPLEYEQRLVEVQPRRITCHKYLAIKGTKPHHFAPMLRFAETTGAKGLKTVEEWDEVFSRY